MAAIDAEKGDLGLLALEYTMHLVNWNKWFGRKQIRFNQPPISPKQSLELLKEISDANWYKDEAFKAYCLAVQDAPARILEMRKVFGDAGLPMMTCYTTMHFLKQHASPLTCLNASTATDIHHLSTIAPPLTKFTGFADWGPGNSGS